MVTEAIKREILRLDALGYKPRAIRAELGLTRGTVAGILDRYRTKQAPKNVLQFPSPEPILKLEQWEGVNVRPQLHEFNEALARLSKDKRYIVVEHDNDNHFPYHDPDAQALRSAIRQMVQPDLIVVGSDAGDFPTISKFEQDRRIDSNRPLSRFREYWWPHVAKLSYDAPKAIKVWIDGNHDERAWLSLEGEKNYDALMAFHSLTIATPGNEVYWRGTGAESLSVNVANALIVTHGTKANTHTAAAILDEFDRQYSVMAGHSHRPDYFTRGTKYKVTATIGGCGCLLMPHYNRRNIFTKWQHGYQYGIVDTLTETAVLNLVDFHHADNEIWAYLHGEIVKLKKRELDTEVSAA